MNDKSLKDLLNDLQEVLEKTEKVDPETRALVSDLDDEIDRLLDPESADDDFDSVVDHAKSIETRFAVDHPVAERFLREIIDALSKVGI
jgi:hypothetical protein